ncbi:MAG: LPS-assembly protein LptD [Candidatus Acididesulfobacter guangdongensis]|uniref:LPS-assembly protein LptD n=1 Tax=Acididesulfobacter guangdongensis TaxID=2597225 RepID=A0A519BIC2_ACIG2|nr:MAG: LPS-assembly protein LptD [Candidatus Acididesulfobacter guangdongensis]
MQNFLNNKIIKLTGIIIVACFTIFNANNVHALNIAAGGSKKEKTTEKTTRINIVADKIIYYKKYSKYIITGNVLITRRHFRLYADKVVYFYKTGFAIATGHVVAYSKGSVTKAKELKVYLKNRYGDIYDSHIHYIKKNIFIYGQKITHKAKGFYQVQNGYITSCRRKPPSWKLYSSFSDIYVGNYAFSYNSLFYIHNVPVLYFPFMVMPIKTKKSSGLLIPTAGYSSLTGYQAGDGYYFDLGQSQDLTYNLNYYSFLGVGNSLKYRYSLNQFSHGSIYGFYMHEDNNAKSAALSSNLTRYLLFSHNIDFIDGMSFKTNLNIPSDPAFYTDFSTNVYQMTKNRLSSNFSATKDFGGFSARMNFLRLDNLFFANYATVDEYPRLSLNGEEELKKFYFAPLYLKFNSSLNVLRSADYYSANRLDIFPDLYMPLKLLSGINITPSAGFRYTGYDDIKNAETNENYSNQSREIYYAGVAGSATLFKNYENNKKGSGSISFVKPYINYNLVRPVNQSGLPLFDQTDYIPPESAVKYGFNWDIENYSKNAISNLFRFDIYQYHSFSGNFINPVNYFNYNNSNSDIIGRLRYHPFGSIYFLGSWSYDDYDYIFDNYNLGTQLTDYRNDSLGLGYTEVNDIQGYLGALNMFNPSNASIFPQSLSLITPTSTLSYASLSTNLNIIDGFSLNLAENYDVTIHKDISNSVGIMYNLGCLGFVASYTNMPYFHQWAFSFGLVLRGIGTYGFGNMVSPGSNSSGMSVMSPNYAFNP